MRAGTFFSSVTVCIILVWPAAAAPTDEQIQKSIQSGAKYLQSFYQGAQGGQGSAGEGVIGRAALTGLALIEAGISEDDPALKSIIATVRENALSRLKVYEASLTIMFLDRLGNREDSPLIQILALRLVNGQLPTGSWAYDCDFGAMSPDEIARLKRALAGEGRLDGGSKGGNPGKAAPKGGNSNGEPKKKDPLASDKPGANALHPDVVRWLQNARQAPKSNSSGGTGDNSNTQFAIIALWCSRKHAVPVDSSLQTATERFRQTQNSDGGWAYHYPAVNAGPGAKMMGSNTTPQMTCAGLICLAVSYGLKARVDAPPKLMGDKAIKAGFDCLGKWVDGKVVANVQNPNAARTNAGNLNENLYFLWSLERMAVIYGIEEIGKTKWYEWGAQALVASQGANGAWSHPTNHITSEEVNTAFAVLFLCRANLAKDLSGRLKRGDSTLKGGSGIAKPPKTPGATGSDSSSKPDGSAAADMEADAAKLCDALVSAKPDARPALIARLRDSKGSVYTEALARAAGRLTGESQQQAREALAKRLTRMTASTLRDMLKDPKENEIRLGAATACGLKADRQYIPDLIDALNDVDALVQKAAHSSLVSLSGKDLGPEKNASAADKEKAVKAWQAWWKVQVK